MNLSGYRVLSLLTVVAACGGAVNAKIGGTVSGLAGGTSIVLVNDGSDALTVNSNGNFSFDKSVGANNSYNVTVQTQPASETCTVVGGAGTVSSRGDDVTNIQVSCVTGSTSTSAVSVSVSGLGVGKTVVLLDNGIDALAVTGTSVTAGLGSLLQLFPTPLAISSNYNVTVGTQPAGQTCSVTNGIGQIPSSGSAPAALVICQ